MTLYHDLILDHYRNPRNQGELHNATHTAEASNPTCGDRLGMQLLVKNGMIENVKFSGSGCAISQASASFVTEAVCGKTATQAFALGPQDVLGLLGVTLSPTRLKCALLALETLQKALTNK